MGIQTSIVIWILAFGFLRMGFDIWNLAGSSFCHCEERSDEAIPCDYEIATRLSGARYDSGK